MCEAITLIGRRWEGAVQRETRREVLAIVKSVGYNEFYAANATDYHPEIKFVLADYLDYQNETLAMYAGTMYRILRTYRTGLALELTAERAPNEEPPEEVGEDE